jgi:hypothetical protein
MQPFSPVSLASLDDCANLDMSAEVMHEEPHPPTVHAHNRRAWALWCACANGCACGWSGMGRGLQIKVKVFGWWKTFGTLKQERAYSTESEASFWRFGPTLIHTPEERQLRSLRVLTGLLACRCFTTASFETEFETGSAASTSLREKSSWDWSVGVRHRPSISATRLYDFLLTWSALQLTSNLKWCKLLCVVLCYHWPLSGPRRTASTLGRVRAAVGRGEALNCDLGRVNKMPPTLPVATWLAWSRYAQLMN